MVKKLHAIVPAGGAGTRLWPLSRVSRPKFLLDLETPGTSLLQATALRLAEVSASITVVTGHRNAEEVKAQLQQLIDSKLIAGDVPIAVLTEPAGRDSMAAIGLATYLLGKKYGQDTIVGSFAADHSVPHPELFHRAVWDAIGAAEEGYVTTIGLKPVGPSTAYGYIQPSKKAVTERTFLVKRFVEKPAANAAAKYVESGYLWNAGMFIMKVSALKEHLAQLHPEMDQALTRISDGWGLLEQTEILNEEWKSIKRIAIDHAIAEPVAASGGVATAIMAGSGWSDLGDFNSIEAVEQAEANGNVLSQVVIDSEESFVRVPDGKAVVLIDVPGAVVVDTGDALLVTNRSSAQRVKEAVDQLKDRGLTQFL